MVKQYIDKVEILMEILPYIENFKGSTVVVKYGGSALYDETVKKTVLKDIAFLKAMGLKPVLVHGGGPEINTMLKRLDIQSEFVKGLRVTDDATMEVVEMILAGKVNKDLSGALTLAGAKAVGISGKDCQTMIAEKLEVEDGDLGHVGEVVKVNTELLETLMNNGFVPVVSTIAVDEEGNTYNINADYGAVAVAAALQAEKLLFLTDVAGVMADKEDAGSVISRMWVSQAKKMIADGTISHGMIPKVECCIKSVEKGIPYVHIIDGRVEHCLLLEIFKSDGMGTLVQADLARPAAVRADAG